MGDKYNINNDDTQCRGKKSRREMKCYTKVDWNKETYRAHRGNPAHCVFSWKKNKLWYKRINSIVGKEDLINVGKEKRTCQSLSRIQTPDKKD